MRRTVDIEDGEIALRWSDQQLTDDDPMVAEILTITGARWSKLARCWVCPLTSLADVLRFAVSHNLQLGAGLVSFKLPKMRESGVTVDGSTLRVSFPYDPRLERAILRVPGASFDAKSKAYTCPSTSIVEVALFCEHYNVPLAPALREVARHWKLQGRRPSDYVGAGKKPDT